MTNGFSQGNTQSTSNILISLSSHRHLPEIAPGLFSLAWLLGRTGAGRRGLALRGCSLLWQTPVTSDPVVLTLHHSPSAGHATCSSTGQRSMKAQRGISLSHDEPPGAIWGDTWKDSYGLFNSWKVIDSWYIPHRSPDRYFFYVHCPLSVSGFLLLWKCKPHFQVLELSILSRRALFPYA